MIAAGSLYGIIELWDIKSGKLLKTLRGYKDIIQDIAFSPNGKMIAAGSLYGIIELWDIKSGKLLKTLRGHEGSIEDIAFSPDGKILASGSIDGAIKFWDIKSGKELVTLYSFDDGEWVAMTPQGYFDASKNGAKYINILTAPLKVTSLDNYYEKFYRPDIVKLAMQGKIIDSNLKISNIKTAPAVEIVKNLPLQTGKKTIKLKVKIKDMGGGIGDIRVYRNGTAIKLLTKSIIKYQGDVVTKDFTIPLEKGKNIIKVIAFEKTNSLKSEEAAITIFANYNSAEKPTLYAFIIGIKEFRNSNLNLQYTNKDAKSLAEVLKNYAKPLFKDVKITLLTTKEQTTKANIIKELKKLQNLKPNDTFLLYLGSHGEILDGNYYLITSNVGSLRLKSIQSSALSQDDLKSLISNIPTRKKLILLDTCYAGALGNAIKVALLTRGMSEDTAIKVLSRATGVNIIAASLSNQQALEGYKEHGVFSYTVIEALKGKADSNKDGYIKTSELINYIDDTLPQITKEAFGVEQFATFGESGQPFPITKVK